MRSRAIYDEVDAFWVNDGDRDEQIADERAEARRRADFERLAAQEYRDTGTVLEWQNDTNSDEDLDA